MHRKLVELDLVWPCWYWLNDSKVCWRSKKDGMGHLRDHKMRSIKLTALLELETTNYEDERVTNVTWNKLRISANEGLMT